MSDLVGNPEDCFFLCQGSFDRKNIIKPQGSNPQFLEHFSVNFARSAKIDNSSVQSGEQSDFSYKIIKSNV